MFCKYCGFKNDDDAMFCVGCGKTVSGTSHQNASPQYIQPQPTHNVQPPPSQNRYYSYKSGSDVPLIEGRARIGGQIAALIILQIIGINLSLLFFLYFKNSTGAKIIGIAFFIGMIGSLIADIKAINTRKRMLVQVCRTHVKGCGLSANVMTQFDLPLEQIQKFYSAGIYIKILSNGIQYTVMTSSAAAASQIESAFENLMKKK